MDENKIQSNKVKIACLIQHAIWEERPQLSGVFAQVLPRWQVITKTSWPNVWSVMTLRISEPTDIKANLRGKKTKVGLYEMGTIICADLYPDDFDDV